MTDVSAISVRTHLVLASVSIALAEALCFCMELLSRIILPATPLSQYQTFHVVATLATAGLIFLAIRLRARRAFKEAMEVGAVDYDSDTHHDAVIADDYPHGWLVQLYIELHSSTWRQVSGEPYYKNL